MADDEESEELVMIAEKARTLLNRSERQVLSRCCSSYLSGQMSVRYFVDALLRLLPTPDKVIFNLSSFLFPRIGRRRIGRGSPRPIIKPDQQHNAPSWYEVGRVIRLAPSGSGGFVAYFRRREEKNISLGFFSVWAVVVVLVLSSTTPVESRNGFHDFFLLSEIWNSIKTTVEMESRD